MTTYKVAFNDYHGGFRLSDKAMRLYCERKGIAVYQDPARHDPVLIQVIEDLVEEANGLCSDIQIVEIREPRYRICEYDGWERVETPSSIEWVVIEDDSASQGGDVRDRVEFDRGELDEIVSSKGAHLENLGDGRWYLAFQHGDGSETVVRFTSRDLRKPTIEKREPRQGGGE